MPLQYSTLSQRGVKIYIYKFIGLGLSVEQVFFLFALKT